MSNNTEKRGPGAPTGRRPVVWICAAMVGDDLICERVTIDDKNPDSESGNFPRTDAESVFMNKYNVKPAQVLGPFYEKKGGKQIKSAKKRGSISRDISDLRLNSNKKQRQAIFGAWHGLVNFIDGDDNGALFVFLRETDPSLGKKKTPPRAGKVSISDLTFTDKSTIENDIVA